MGFRFGCSSRLAGKETHLCTSLRPKLPKGQRRGLGRWRTGQAPGSWGGDPSLPASCGPGAPSFRPPCPRSPPQRAAELAQQTTARGSSCCAHTSEATAKLAEAAAKQARHTPDPGGEATATGGRLRPLRAPSASYTLRPVPAQPCDHGQAGFRGSEGPAPLQCADSAGFPGRTPSPPAAGLCLPLSWCDTEESHTACHHSPAEYHCPETEGLPWGTCIGPHVARGPRYCPWGPCASLHVLPQGPGGHCSPSISSSQVTRRATPGRASLGPAAAPALDLHHLHQENSPLPSLLWLPRSDKRPATSGNTEGHLML